MRRRRRWRDAADRDYANSDARIFAERLADGDSHAHAEPNPYGNGDVRRNERVPAVAVVVSSGRPEQCGFNLLHIDRPQRARHLRERVGLLKHDDGCAGASRS
jgi:hypothetical protein